MAEFDSSSRVHAALPRWTVRAARFESRPLVLAFEWQHFLDASHRHTRDSHARRHELSPYPLALPVCAVVSEITETHALCSVCMQCRLAVRSRSSATPST